VYERHSRDRIVREVHSHVSELTERLDEHGLNIETLGTMVEAPSSSSHGDAGSHAFGDAGAQPRRPPELQAFAREAHLLVRVVDDNGEVLRATPAVHAERWSNLRRLTLGADDFVMGPEPGPELVELESRLPRVADRREVQQALGGRESGLWRDDEGGQIAAYYLALPHPDGDGAIYVTRVYRRGIAVIYDHRLQLVRLTVPLTVFALILALFVGYRVVKPVGLMQSRIATYLRRPGAGPPPELALDRRDELGDLSRSFHSMASKLSRQADEASKLADELAHDMKNPIATVRATSELFARGAELSEERRERLARALGQAAAHLDRSVDGLLQLSRLSVDLDEAERVEVDLSAMCRALVECAAESPAWEHLSIRIDSAAQVVVLGSGEQLERAISTLLDNALAFATTEVRLVIRQSASMVEVLVSDDGPGVPSGDRGKIFTRFFTARPDELAPGTGLGLVIAQTVARATVARSRSRRTARYRAPVSRSRFPCPRLSPSLSSWAPTPRAACCSRISPLRGCTPSPLL